MDIATTKMSSRGQIVIPSEMRKNIKIGEKLVILENNGQFIIKKVSEIKDNFEEDLKFARKTNEVIDRFEAGKGKFNRMKEKEFLDELETW